MNELATILLPTYNGEKYIEQMLDSIYKQSYRPIEVIITDDASTDRTVAVVAHWLKKRSTEELSFKIIRNKKNRGLSGNISRCEKYIHGKFLFLADQDDIWKEEKVSSQIAYLKENEDCIMCICDRGIINENNEIVCNSLFQYKHARLQKRNYNMVLNSKVQYPANCICLRADHIDKIFPIPTQICEHDTFITIMAAHYGRVGYINKMLVLYRIHENNLSHKFALETNDNLLKAGYIILKAYKRKNEREQIDPEILTVELKSRFDENIPKWSKNLYSGKIDHIYWKTILYILYNIDKWKKFNKNTNVMTRKEIKHEKGN